jgi:aspartate/methionine/tyrosine aminotransferase
MHFPVLDFSHGHQLPVGGATAEAVRLANEIFSRNHIPPYATTSPGPLELRAAVLKGLIHPRTTAANQLVPDDVVCWGNSSLHGIRAAIQMLGATHVLTPAGGYKRTHQHCTAAEVELLVLPVTAEGKILPQVLNAGFQSLPPGAKPLFLFTQPGNPIDPTYSKAELQEIAAKCFQYNMPILLDHAFEAVARKDYIPMDSLTHHDGTPVFDLCVCTYSTSKTLGVNQGHRIGAMIAGIPWMRQMLKDNPLQFFPDILHAASSAFTIEILEKSADSYRQERHARLSTQRSAFLHALEQSNKRIASSVGTGLENAFLHDLFPGQAPWYPFVCVGLCPKQAGNLGITDDTQFAELLKEYGVLTLPLSQTGLDPTLLGVRVDTVAYDEQGYPSGATHEFFERLETMLFDVTYRGFALEQQRS